jgi:hypothetical protein
MASRCRTAIAILGAALLVSFAASAYEVRLSEEAVREAYFLGQRRDETTAQFLETYRRYFPIPKSGPHVYAVELFTPYAQAVETASKRGTNYSAQQAEQDYLLRDDSVRVGVHMRYTSSYGPGKMNEGSTHSDRREDFHVKLIQDGKTIDCRSSRYEGTHMSLGGGKGGGGSRPTGFIIWQEYAPANMESSEATVEIDTPDGQHISVTFDLSRLR